MEELKRLNDQSASWTIVGNGLYGSDTVRPPSSIESGTERSLAIADSKLTAADHHANGQNGTNEATDDDKTTGKWWYRCPECEYRSKKLYSGTDGHCCFNESCRLFFVNSKDHHRA